MANQQLIMMMGLPRSGKTTYVKNHFPHYAVVSGDAIRLALHGQRFLSAAEPMVAVIAELMFKALKNSGCNIVVDETNVTAKRRNRWWQLGVQQVIQIDTPKEVCKQRAIDTDQTDLIPVIDRMAMEWEEHDCPPGKLITVTLSGD